MFDPRTGGRPDANHVAIIITDGRSQNKQETLEAAKIAKEKGIQMFAIGVGQYLDIEELEGIGSEPAEQHVFNVSTFSELEGIKDKLPSNACEGMSRHKPFTNVSLKHFYQRRRVGQCDLYVKHLSMSR